MGEDELIAPIYDELDWIGRLEGRYPEVSCIEVSSRLYWAMVKRFDDHWTPDPDNLCFYGWPLKINGKMKGETFKINYD